MIDPAAALDKIVVSTDDALLPGSSLGPRKAGAGNDAAQEQFRAAAVNSVMSEDAESGDPVRIP